MPCVKVFGVIFNSKKTIRYDNQSAVRAYYHFLQTDLTTYTESGPAKLTQEVANLV